MTETTEKAKELLAEELATETKVRPEDIHLPPSSYWPIVLAFGFSAIVAGLALSLALTIMGVVITLVAVIGWVIEPVEVEEP
jgi:hypothetical protein